MKLFKFFLIGFSFCFSSFFVFADGKDRSERPIQLQLLSSSAGQGFSAGYNFNSTWYGGLQYTFSDYSSNEFIKVSGTFTTINALGRASIWEDSAFYVELGILQRDWVLEAESGGYMGKPFYQTYTTKYQVKVEYPSTGLSGGIGWNWIADFGLSGGLGLGIMTGAKPEITVSDGNNLATDEQIEYEEKEWEDYYTLNSFFIISARIGYNF